MTFVEEIGVRLVYQSDSLFGRFCSYIPHVYSHEGHLPVPLTALSSRIGAYRVLGHPLDLRT